MKTKENGDKGEELREINQRKREEGIECKENDKTRGEGEQKQKCKED